MSFAQARFEIPVRHAGGKGERQLITGAWSSGRGRGWRFKFGSHQHTDGI